LILFNRKRCRASAKEECKDFAPLCGLYLAAQ